MGTLYESILSLCKEKGIKGGRMCADLNISKSLMTDLKSGRKKSINAETAQKIANYFGVTIDRLLGATDYPTPAGQKEPPPAEPEAADSVTQELYGIIGKMSRGQLMLLLEKAQEIEKF